MTRLPQKQSLLAQTYAVLKEEIQAGAWARWLPGEWDLCEQLKVSRRTLRGALAQLEHEGLIKGGRGRRRQIRRAGKTVFTPPASNTVILLTSEQLALRPSFSMFLLDDLRQHLSAAGYRLEVHFHAANQARRPGPALEQLVKRAEPAGWLLSSMTAPTQRWFSQRGLPCVIIGSRHEGVALPSVDIDFRALCRHAAGLLLGKGHARLALLNPRSGLAGDIESERGFKEAIERFHPGGQAIIAQHDGTAKGLCDRLQMVLRTQAPGTGLLVSGSKYALMTLCFLLRRGLRLPQDAALISRDEDAFMQYAIPTIAHYSANPTVLARKVSRIFLQLVRFGVNEPRDYRVMPRFVPGDTLG